MVLSRTKCGSEVVLLLPFISGDADGCWQRLPHRLHELLKLSLRDQALLLVVVLKQLVLFDNVCVACPPALKHTCTSVKDTFKYI